MARGGRGGAGRPDRRTASPSTPRPAPSARGARACASPAIRCPTRAGLAAAARGGGAGARPGPPTTCCWSCSRAAPRPCSRRPSAASRLEDKAAVTTRLLRAGRDHRRAERRAQAPLAPQGRRAGARGGARPGASCLVLSDVVGDDLSHHRLRPRPCPTRPPTPTRSTCSTPRACWRRRRRRCARHLEAGAARRACPRRPSPATRSSGACATRVVGSNRQTSRRRRAEARRQGLRPLVLDHAPGGRGARGRRACSWPSCASASRAGRPAAPPVCLLAGGETTVTVRGDGRGGRNQEMAVAAAEPLAAFPADAVVASLATDGVDGGQRRGRRAWPTDAPSARARGAGPGPARGRSWPRTTRGASWARSATSSSPGPTGHERRGPDRLLAGGRPRRRRGAVL